MSESYRWRYEDAAGAAPAEGTAHSATFPTQADAEAWFTESWQELADSGVHQVTLVREGTEVYGPMPLSAE